MYEMRSKPALTAYYSPYDLHCILSGAVDVQQSQRKGNLKIHNTKLNGTISPSFPHLGIWELYVLVLTGQSVSMPGNLNMHPRICLDPLQTNVRVGIIPPVNVHLQVKRVMLEKINPLLSIIHQNAFKRWHISS